MDIIIDKLNKSYDGRAVLKDFSAVLKHGEITALMGASGAGKTTLANILLGLAAADSGRVSGLEGVSIGAVFQEDRLLDNVSAVKNIRLVSPSFSEKEILSELALLLISEETAHKASAKLSGGERRRAAIVRAMLSHAEFLILDEPFKGLDEQIKQKAMDYVLKKAAGRTVLLITHDAAEAEYLTAGIIRLNARDK